MKQHTVRLVAVTAACILLVLPIAAGSGVSLGVEHKQQASLLLTTEETTADRPKAWGAELHNEGSTAFTGRIRLDVLDADNTTLFRTWSDPVQVEPGAFAARELIYYDPSRSGNLTARIVAHYGTERITKTAPFTTTPQDTRQGFEVAHAWTDDNTVNLRVTAPPDVDTYHVSVNDEATRRFTQKEITNHGGTQVVSLDYNPPITDTEQAQVTISSPEGEYHYTEEVELRRPTGWVDRVKQWLTVLIENTVIM